MQIGAFIEQVLKGRGLSKTWLYQTLRRTFGEESFPYVFSNFSNKFTSNSLSATEFMMIASVLELDLNQLLTYQNRFRKTANVVEVKEKTLPEKVASRIKRNNSFLRHPNLHFDSKSKTDSFWSRLTILHRDDEIFYLVGLGDGKGNGEIVATVERVNETENTLSLMAEFSGHHGGLEHWNQLRKENPLTISQWHAVMDEIERVGKAWALLCPTEISYHDIFTEELGLEVEHIVDIGSENVSYGICATPVGDAELEDEELSKEEVGTLVKGFLAKETAKLTNETNQSHVFSELIEEIEVRSEKKQVETKSMHHSTLPEVEKQECEPKSIRMRAFGAVPLMGNKMVLQRCAKGHEWESLTRNDEQSQECPYCSGKNCYKDSMI